MRSSSSPPPAPAPPKKKKDPNRPKRPRSAYNFFFQRTRLRLQKEELDGESAALTGAIGSDIGREKFNRLGKRIGELWAVISSAERTELDALAANDYIRYDHEMSIYNKNLIDESSDGNVEVKKAKPKKAKPEVDVKGNTGSVSQVTKDTRFAPTGQGQVHFNDQAQFDPHPDLRRISAEINQRRSSFEDMLGELMFIVDEAVDKSQAMAAMTTTWPRGSFAAQSSNSVEKELLSLQDNVGQSPRELTSAGHRRKRSSGYDSYLISLALADEYNMTLDHKKTESDMNVLWCTSIDDDGDEQIKRGSGDLGVEEKNFQFTFGADEEGNS